MDEGWEVVSEVGHRAPEYSGGCCYDTLSMFVCWKDEVRSMVVWYIHTQEAEQTHREIQKFVYRNPFPFPSSLLCWLWLRFAGLCAGKSWFPNSLMIFNWPIVGYKQDPRNSKHCHQAKAVSHNHSLSHLSICVHVAVGIANIPSILTILSQPTERRAKLITTFSTYLGTDSYEAATDQ